MEDRKITSFFLTRETVDKFREYAKSQGKSASAALDGLLSILFAGGQGK